MGNLQNISMFPKLRKGATKGSGIHKSLARSIAKLIVKQLDRFPNYVSLLIISSVETSASLYKATTQKYSLCSQKIIDYICPFRSLHMLSIPPRAVKFSFAFFQCVHVCVKGKKENKAWYDDHIDLDFVSCCCKVKKIIFMEPSSVVVTKIWLVFNSNCSSLEVESLVVRDGLVVCEVSLYLNPTTV